MCVSQFRDYVNASYFKADENGSYAKDLGNKNLQVMKNGYTQHRRSDGSIYVSTYYVTDLKKVKRLARIGNPYAIQHLAPSPTAQG